MGGEGETTAGKAEVPCPAVDIVDVLVEANMPCQFVLGSLSKLGGCGVTLPVGKRVVSRSIMASAGLPHFQFEL